MNRSTRQIERDVERTRSEIEDTVEALREKMSLGQMVDEVTHYLRDSGGSEMMSNLAAQARANPMPLALVGIGLAWLMSGRGQPATAVSGGDGSAVRSSLRGAGETVGQATGAVAQSGRKTGAALSSRMHEAGDAASSRLHQAGDAAADSYGRMSDQAAEMQRTISRLVEDEPLILAGVGLAAGVAIAAMLPPTEAENRVLGEQRDKLKHRAEDMAREEWDKAKSVANEAAAAAKSEIERGGPPEEAAQRATRSATHTAERAANRKGLAGGPRKG